MFEVWASSLGEAAAEMMLQGFGLLYNVICSFPSFTSILSVLQDQGIVYRLRVYNPSSSNVSEQLSKNHLTLVRKHYLSKEFWYM